MQSDACNNEYTHELKSTAYFLVLFLELLVNFKSAAWNSLNITACSIMM